MERGGQPCRPRGASDLGRPGPASGPYAEGRRVGDLSPVRGGPWRQVREGLPPACGLLASVLAANEAETDAFYAANNKGLFRSTDRGSSWEELPIVWPGGAWPGRAHAFVVVPE